MIAYACVGCVSAVMQLISVTLASAYVAQVSRKRMREKQQSWVCRNQLENQVTILNFLFRARTRYPSVAVILNFLNGLFLPRELHLLQLLQLVPE